MNKANGANLYPGFIPGLHSPFEQKPMSFFACPQCKTTLERSEQSLRCVSCAVTYPESDGIPHLIATLDAHEATEQKFWDWQYTEETRTDAPLLDFHEHFLAPLRALPRGSRVLEVACGTRGDTLHLAHAGATLVFTDIAPTAVRTIRARAHARGITPAPTVAVADAEHLPFPDATFDGVFTAASLHHAHNPQHMLAEMRRVTKPGGWIIVGVEPASWPYTLVYPLLRPLQQFIRKHRARPFDSVADDETRGFRRRDLERLFRDASLEVHDIRPVKFLLEWYDSGCRLLERLTHRPITPWYSVQRILSVIDRVIMHIPLVNRFPWHWNVIARKPSTLQELHKHDKELTVPNN